LIDPETALHSCIGYKAKNITKTKAGFRGWLAGLLVGLVLVLGTVPVYAAEQSIFEDVERIVAIGDLHGGYEKFVEILRIAALVDENNHWIGGQTHLVQTGDIVDRGADSRKIIDLLRQLEPEAVEVGGMVHTLIGNHEAMNIQGDLRYVHQGEYEAFETRRSRLLQRGYYRQYVDAVKARLPEDEWPEFDNAYKAAWEERFPPGYVEHRLDWQPEGEYGRWVSENNAVIIIGETMFLHGGLSVKYSDLDIDVINARIAEELSSDEVVEDGYITDPDGPLWYRGLAIKSQTDLEELAHLDALMLRHNIKRVVIGHTTTPGAIIPRFGGRVIQIDVGLGPAYGGNNAFLVIENGVPIAVHRGHRVPLPLSRNDSLLEYLEILASFGPEPSPLDDMIAANQPLTDALEH
jgi:Calcineurin-like phosphoesterase